jgi:carbon starvation protein
MIFVLITSCWAAVLKLIDWYAEEKWLLVTIDVIVLVTSVLVILEAASVISKFRNKESSTT